MNVNWGEVLKVGVKVTVAVIGGIAVFAGVSKLTEKKSNNQQSSNASPNGREDENLDPNQRKQLELQDKYLKQNNYPCQQRGFNETGQKLVSSLQTGQLVISSVINVVNGLVSVAQTINQAFDKNFQHRMVNDPSACMGYYGNTTVPSGGSYRQPADETYYVEDPVSGRIARCEKRGNIIDVY